MRESCHPCYKHSFHVSINLIEALGSACRCHIYLIFLAKKRPESKKKVYMPSETTSIVEKGLVFLKAVHWQYKSNEHVTYSPFKLIYTQQYVPKIMNPNNNFVRNQEKLEM